MTERTLVRVCRVEELPPGGACRVEVNGTPVAVFNLGGTFHAIGDTCTHEEASLSEGMVDEEDEIVECPKHGAMFHIPTGQVRSLPATRSEPAFPVRVENGEIYVEA
jgi:nitrite reductase/ring-hydroxylating ferredoxin subunit